ncbi:MAG TPA: hypothetical protein VHN78_11370, partial [Chloroflexota bacterium]|nr:hypothetical protein [Chloroflexota bacterium]
MATTDQAHSAQHVASDPMPASRSGAGTLRTTRYSDVCGGTDELKRILNEERSFASTATGRETLLGLVDDGRYMLARMEERLREYQRFRAELLRLVQQLQAIEEPRLQQAAAEAERIRAILQPDAGPQGAQLSDATVEEIVQRAEEIRQVANDMEGALRRHKEAAIAVGRAYVALRGSRGWDDGIQELAADAGTASGAAEGGAAEGGAAEGGAASARLPAGVPEAWLPPAPHREVVLDWLRRGRAVLLSEAEAARFPPGPQGREPLVQFEDGGVMPLRAVRWSEAVQN